MKETAPRPEPHCTEPVAEPFAQHIWGKLKHDLGFHRPGERHFERPVSWLLGRQMMGSIKGTLLYTAFGSKLDPRDWMQAHAFPFKEKAAALRFWKTLASGTREACELRQFEEAPADRADPAEFWRRRGEFWFDYVADTGDGMKATYSIAYLCMSDLYARHDASAMPPPGDEWLETCPNPAAGYARLLPRGEFLMIGGDTAYHLSDYMTLATRIQQPFQWAFEDLKKNLGLKFDESRRPLFGIPGNHDYYDQLDGFRRQFRHPFWGKREDADKEKQYQVDPLKGPQLMIPGFRRWQESSYLALRLPFDWWLWGLDTEVGQVDERQRDFFRRLCDEDPADPTGEKIIPPDKLIVCTCAPTTVFGQIANPNDEKSADAFAQLGLPQPFLPDRGDTGAYDFACSGDAKLEPKQCRLDLSGDVHQYARYWGPPNAHTPTPRPEHPQVQAPTSESYASVVSGIGGAFHHPTTTFAGEIGEQVLYPPEKCSREEVARGIFNFWTVLTGGSVYLAGFIIAFVICFAASVPQSSRQIINNLGFLQSLKLVPAQPEMIDPTVSPLPATPEGFASEPLRVDPASTTVNEAIERAARQPVKPFWGWLGITTWTPPDPCRSGDEFDFPHPVYFFGPCRTDMPAEMRAGIAMLLGSLGLIGFALYKRDWLFGSELKKAKVETPWWQGGGAVDREDRIRVEKLGDELYHKPHRRLWLIVAVTVVLAFGGLATVKPFRDHITPFGSSLIVLFSLIWAVAAVALAIRYSEHLFAKAHKDSIVAFDWWLTGSLTVLSVLSIAFGLWSFGGHNVPALLAADIVFIVVLCGAFFIALLLAVVAGDKKGPGGKHRVLFWLLGLWHAILQVFIPFVLIRRGTWLTWVVALVLVFAPIPLGKWLMTRPSERVRRRGLLLAFFVYGALMLSLPYLTGHFADPPMPFASAEWQGWWGLLPSLLAGVAGAVLCCLWFGWYLAVSLSYHGHNNEAGGAARIERFKEFIRFRITPNDITGYVIAVDDPGKEGDKLKPKLVDVFRLRAKGSA